MITAIRKSFYRWLNTPYPTPGTGNMAFDWYQSLPLFRIQTPGLQTHRQFVNVKQPQIISVDTQTTAGLGGLQAGQYLQQGLITPQSDASKNNEKETVV